MTPVDTVHPLADGRTSAAALVLALRGTRPDRVPLWFDLPSRDGYDRTRGSERGDASETFESRMDPARVAAHTLEPLEEIGVDAVALATDLAAPVALAGEPIAFRHDGAVLETPIRTGTDALRLRPLDPERLAPIAQATRLVVAGLDRTPLIATAAGPFALACLLVEGGPTTDQRRARTLMYSDSRTWAAVLNWCADVAGLSLRAQVRAGASAVHVVDPFLGALSRHDHFKRVLPHTQRVLSHLRGLDVPVLLTGTGTGDHLDLLARAGASTVGVDWRMPLDTAVERVGPEVPLQGNLDPALLAAPWQILEAHVRDVLERGRGAKAHILSVGGAIPPETDRAVLRRIAELVRDPS